MNNKIKNFTDLDAWREGHRFVLKIYEIVKKFPRKELFGLSAQLERAAVSITSNVAEGFSRYYFKDKVRFYYMSRGSISETQNLLLVAKDLKYIDTNLFNENFEQTCKIQSLINGLINSISKQSSKNHF